MRFSTQLMTLGDLADFGEIESDEWAARPSLSGLIVSLSIAGLTVSLSIAAVISLIAWVAG